MCVHACIHKYVHVYMYVRVCCVCMCLCVSICVHMERDRVLYGKLFTRYPPLVRRMLIVEKP